jgi:hypothetical protein
MLLKITKGKPLSVVCYEQKNHKEYLYLALDYQTSKSDLGGK